MTTRETQQEKADDREERFFVGFDREERRYLFQHILPRLNATDIKFLYEVNTETRKLIKRSSRAGDLKKRFKLKRCRRYRRWKLRGSIIRGRRMVAKMKNIFLHASCSNE